MFYPILGKIFISDFKIEEGNVTRERLIPPLRVISIICLCKILRFEFNLILLLFVLVMFRIYHIRIKNQAIFGGIFNFFC
jgi:hypothetical protein